MSEEQQNKRELEFLMNRYDQLVEQQMSTNEIIHNTFYISIVVFGALVSVIPQLEEFIIRSVLYVFASGIFFAMLLWNRTYLNTRAELQRHMSNVISEIERREFNFAMLNEPGDFFSGPGDFHHDRWEQNWTKEKMLSLYYLTLSGISIGIFSLELFAFYF